MSDLRRNFQRALSGYAVPWTDARQDAVYEQLIERRRRIAGASALVSLAVLAAVGTWTLWPGRHVGGELKLADGSRAQLLVPGSILREISVQPDRLVMTLESGRARFDVVRRPSRLFRVEAGPVAVEVLGTRFEVDRGPEDVRVAVEHGHVRVVHEGDVSDLLDGQTLTIPLVKTPAAPAPVADATEPQAVPHALRPVVKSKLAHPPRHHTIAQAQTRPSRGTALLADTEPEVGAGPSPAEGRAPPSQSPTPPGPPPPASPPASPPSDVEQLMAQADRARTTHHPEAAVAALRQIVRAHAPDPLAPLAAFTLGRLLADELGRPREAAEAFAATRRLGATEPLSENALLREVRAWGDAGDRAQARARAREYIERYPMGYRVGFIQRFLE